ncbi:MAG: ATP-binding protein, partial [Actinomycetota bacterium]
LVHPDDRGRLQEAVEAAVRDRQAFELSHRLFRPDGAVRELYCRGDIFLDEAGKPVRLAGTAHDVTERRRAEEALRRTEARARQAERLESVGQLAGGIAHDFNNLLAVILNYASFVTDELGNDHPARADVEEIRQAADRAAALTQQLLIFSRRERVKPEVFDVNDVVSDTEKLLRRTLGEHVELVTALASDLWPIEADRGQLEQVLVNLAVNARGAMPDGGTLTVETSNTDLAEELVTAGTALPPGRYARIAVTDTGTGMSPEVTDRVFEPFYTTKPKGEGTGLGLATVYGIVEQANGQVRADSELGVGTSFTIYLPRTTDAAASPFADVAAELPGVSARATVLVVEDEDAVRELVVRILRRHRYTVLAAAAGMEAIRLAGAHEDNVDLLLADVIMPDVSGREVSEMTGLRTLYMSGYTDEITAEHGILAHGESLLAKPFSADELLRAVRDALLGAKTGSV